MICKKCKKDKEEKFFTRNKLKLNGLSSYCKDCVNDYKKAKAEENRQYKQLYEF